MRAQLPPDLNRSLSRSLLTLLGLFLTQVDIGVRGQLPPGAVMATQHKAPSPVACDFSSAKQVSFDSIVGLFSSYIEALQSRLSAKQVSFDSIAGLF